MQKKIIIFLATLVVAFIVCGALSAATVKSNDINTAKISTVGATTSQTNPAISGTRIVWEENGVIYLKNLANGFIGKVYKSSNEQYSPAISGSIIVWEEWYESGGDLYLEYLKTKKIVKLKSEGYDEYQGVPAIDGNILVWEDAYTYSGGYLDYSIIYVRNLAGGVSREITSSSVGNRFNPDISGYRVVWEEESESLDSYNIYVKNLKTNHWGKVLSSNELQTNPHISGTRIVWEQKDSSGHTAIYLKDLATLNWGKVYNSGKNQQEPAIDGDRVVWTQDTTNGHKAIYVKNLKTKKTDKLTP